MLRPGVVLRIVAARATVLSIISVVLRSTLGYWFMMKKTFRCLRCEEDSSFWSLWLSLAGLGHGMACAQTYAMANAIGLVAVVVGFQCYSGVWQHRGC